jgi:hypothetical protein
MSHHRQKQKVRGIGKKNPINISYDNLICPECKTTFNGQYLQQFYTHYEACWTAAVEREHRRLLLERFRPYKFYKIYNQIFQHMPKEKATRKGLRTRRTTPS